MKFKQEIKKFLISSLLGSIWLTWLDSDHGQYSLTSIIGNTIRGLRNDAVFTILSLAFFYLVFYIFYIAVYIGSLLIHRIFKIRNEGEIWTATILSFMLLTIHITNLQYIHNTFRSYKYKNRYASAIGIRTPDSADYREYVSDQKVGKAFLNHPAAH